MTDEQLAELRVYKPAEVARMLNIPITRVETWVREDRVRHLRAGEVRGVEFTAEHVRELAGRLPELMGGHRGGRAGASDGRQAVSAPAGVQPTPEIIAGWAQLTPHRPVPRTTARRR
ncbi:hypothetical protein [Geodermatophilus sp. FMUSA9-8]|uniref:hypothetical protein n=1 Tax=Geodermatophilus sp. FMUSA9-8 TaxID=3120155 RepID=UPI00300A941B